MRHRVVNPCLMTFLVAALVAGCGMYGFRHRMNALVGQDVSVLTEAWGPAHRKVRCRKTNRRRGREHNELTRRACKWEEQGMSAYIWTLVEPIIDERKSALYEGRVTPPCSVVVVVGDGRIRAWQVAPYQECRDYRAVETVPRPRSEQRGGGS